MESRRAHDAGGGDTDAIIRVDGLSYMYPRATTPAVHDVSFRVGRGEIFGFLGPSGAGKSTIQKVLFRLLRGYRGAVAVLGRELGAWGADYYERIGVAFELPYHYHKLTGIENLEFFRSLYAGPTDDPRALLEQFGLDGDADRRVGEYSKGMRMRLGLARALLHRPALLYLDEPTAGLDPATSRRVRDIIGARRDDGASVFLTTHNMGIADELCDRVAFIADGRIVLIDRPRDLRLRYGERTVRVELAADGSMESRVFPLDGIGANEDFLHALRSGRVQTIHTQETTLEDVFLRVTGRALS